MKIWVHKATDEWRKGQLKEYSDLKECIDKLLILENFGSFDPSVIVSKADDMTKEKSGCEDCEYDVMIYDTWIE